MTDLHHAKRELPGLLDRVADFYARFVVFPSTNELYASSLWVAHAHAMSAWDSTPRIGFFSPEPGSGKTRSLEVLCTLCPNAVEAVNATPAYLFRKVGAGAEDPSQQVTIAFDELDTLFGARAKDHEETRGLINAGHRRGAVAGRCVVRGKSIETEEIEAYCAVAMAGLGFAPDTIMSRTIAIRMKRRGPDQKVEQFRRRLHVPEGNALRDGLAANLAALSDELSTAWPAMPDGVEDRAADVWEPLLAIADEAGGHWPQRAREAAVALVADSKRSTPSLGVRLLSDIRSAFREDEDEVGSAVLIERLCSVDEAPWGDMRGKPIDPRKLARVLSPYEIRSCNLRVSGNIVKGYRRSDFQDAWDRYLPSPPKNSATSATPATDWTPGDD